MKKMLTVMLMAITTFSLSACSTAPDEDAATVIKKAWEKIAEQNEEYETGNVKLDLDMDIDFDEIGKGSLDIDMDMDVDARDLKNPKIGIKMEASGDGDFGGQNGKAEIKGEMRSIDKVTYLFLEKFSLDSGNAETDLMANFAQNFFKGKWISIDEDLLNDGSLSPEEVSSEVMVQLIKNHQLIKLKEDLGNRTYIIELDKKAFKNFMIAVSKETGEELSESDLEIFNEEFTDAALAAAGVSYEIQVKINTDYEFSWVKASMNVDDPDSEDKIKILVEGTSKGPLTKREIEGTASFVMSGEQEGSMTMEISGVGSKREVTIEVPEGAEAFDPSSFLGLGGALGVPGGSLPPEAELGL